MYAFVRRRRSVPDATGRERFARPLCPTSPLRGFVEAGPSRSDVCLAPSGGGEESHPVKGRAWAAHDALRRLIQGGSHAPFHRGRVRRYRYVFTEMRLTRGLDAEHRSVSSNRYEIEL